MLPTCAHGWETEELLGKGTSGTVYMVRRRRTTAACKLQILKSASQKDKFDREIKNQHAFAPFAPRVLFHCAEKIGKNEWKAVIIMELIQVELDKWLSVERTPEELQDLVDQIAKLGKFCVRKKRTHGDLALFNIARTRDGRWIAIDFDRSSTTVFNPNVDLYRLQMELGPAQYRSNGTKPLNEQNVRWLVKHGIPVWQKAWKLPNTRNAKETNDYWTEQYDDYYCKKAKIPCLE